MKRFVYALVVVLVVALVVFLGYYFGYRKGQPGIEPSTTGPGGLPYTPGQQFPGSPLTQTPQPTTVPTTQPTLEPAEQFGQASESLVLDFVVKQSGSVLLVQPDGKVVEITPQGQATVVNQTTLPALVEARFSADGTKIAAITQSYQAPKFQLFDATKKQWAALDENVQSVAWSPSEPKFARLVSENGVSRLEIFDAATGAPTPQEAVRLRGQDLALAWPAPSTVFIMPRGSAYAKDSLVKLDVASGTLASVLQDQLGLQIVWDATAAKGLLLQSNQNSLGGILRLVDGEGNVMRLLDLLTLPSKCVFGEKIAPATSGKPAAATPVLYCAVPRDREALEASPLPDAYFTRALFTEDSFYEINVETGAATPVFEDASVRVDATNLKIANGRLYFVNRYNQKLYGLMLPK